MHVDRSFFALCKKYMLTLRYHCGIIMYGNKKSWTTRINGGEKEIREWGMGTAFHSSSE